MAGVTPHHGDPVHGRMGLTVAASIQATTLALARAGWRGIDAAVRGKTDVAAQLLRVMPSCGDRALSEPVSYQFDRAVVTSTNGTYNQYETSTVCFRSQNGCGADTNGFISCQAYEKGGQLWHRAVVNRTMLIFSSSRSPSCQCSRGAGLLQRDANRPSASVCRE